jgi:hypothetical protein
MLLRTLTRISINVHLVSYVTFAEKNFSATNKKLCTRPLHSLLYYVTVYT